MQELAIFKSTISIHEILAYCLLDKFYLESSVSYEKIKQSIGDYFCLSNEGLEILIDQLCQNNKEFVFNIFSGFNAA